MTVTPQPTSSSSFKRNVYIYIHIYENPSLSYFITLRKIHVEGIIMVN